MLSRTIARMGMAAVLVWWPQAVWGWQPAEPMPAVQADPGQDANSSLFQPPAVEEVYPYYPSAPEAGIDAPYSDPNWEAANVFETSYVPVDRRWWVPTAFTGQFMWLNRSGSAQSVLLTGGIPDPVTLVVAHSTAVSMSDLTFPVEAGFRGSLLFGRWGRWQTELAYLGIFDQRASVRYAPDASLGVTETNTNFFDAVITNPVTDITVAYESDLQSAEWNWWFDDGWRIQPVVGIRWISQDEQFEQYETENWADGTLANVSNDLIGGQVGFRTYFYERGRLSVFCIAKGGIYHNSASLSADIEFGGAQLALLQQNGSATSYSGEINLTAMWQLTPFCNLHAGYTGLWLSEVVVAGDQFSSFALGGGTGTFNYGDVRYQGGHIGLTLSW